MSRVFKILKHAETLWKFHLKFVFYFIFMFKLQGNSLKLINTSFRVGFSCVSKMSVAACIIVKHCGF